MAQPQGVDREPPARLRREKRRDGLGRGRQGGLAMLVTPVGKAGDGGAVGAPGVVGAGGAAVIGGGGLGLGKTQCRRRQLDNGLELEPVTDLVRIGAAGQPRRERLARPRGQWRDRGIIDRFAIWGHRIPAFRSNTWYRHRRQRITGSEQS